ncbi:glycosyltransferase [Candidatus Pelagibacter sp.]|nr:glycosyltransferase [Candidatus Pelagibacter sp.]
MKISIIMCVKNSMPYIMASIESFRKQKFIDKELIIVWSNSNDNTVEYLRTISDKNIKKYQLNASIYKCLNFGITKSKGDIIGVLHSDDIFFSPNVLGDVFREFKLNKSEIIYGNILFSEKNNLLNVKRTWSKIKLSKIYDIPPHTGTFISKKVFSKFRYNQKYKISADTDLMIKVFQKNIKRSYLNKYISIMRIGGISTDFSAFLKKAKEDLDIFKINNLNYFDYIKKILFKTNQYFLKESYKVKNYHKTLNKISKVKFLNLNKKIEINGKIVSALNLAFMSYNYKYKLYKHNYLFWPDGIFSTYIKNVKKIAGRDYFAKFVKKINKGYIKFNDIYLLGNLPNISREWVKSNLIKSFIHKKLPYCDIDKMYLKVKKYNFKKNSLIILTLPTPKQELLANKIIKDFPDTTILCIGGSINMLSDYETRTPLLFYNLNLEWIWRLRFDTRRRILRLMESIYLMIKMRFTGKNTIF